MCRPPSHGVVLKDRHYTSPEVNLVWSHYGHKDEKLACRILILGNLFYMAERAGFEPAVRKTHTRFPSVLLKPLGHLSGRFGTLKKKRGLFYVISANNPCKTKSTGDGTHLRASLFGLVVVRVSTHTRNLKPSSKPLRFETTHLGRLIRKAHFLSHPILF